MAPPTILCADADRNLCRIIAKALSGKGFQVVVAHDGLQALATLQSLRLEEATLTERAAELPSSALAPRLPSRAEAFGLGETFTAYVAERHLTLSAFASARTGSTLGGKEAPAVSHTLEVGGPAATLIQMLDLARDVPSSVVRSLEFQRAGGSHDQWVMSMTVIVFYDEPEGQS